MDSPLHPLSRHGSHQYYSVNVSAHFEALQYSNGDERRSTSTLPDQVGDCPLPSYPVEAGVDR